MIQNTRPLLPEILALHGKWRAKQAALVFGDKTTSWGEFNHRLNQVAHGLLGPKLGLNHGARVIVLMSNSAAMVECLFGIMKAGMVSAPINISVSDKALLNMIKDSGATAICVSADLVARVSGLYDDLPQACQGNVIVYSSEESDELPHGWPHNWYDFESLVSTQKTTEPEITIAPNDLLNIIYSSGTTGEPKGIAHTHQGRLDWAYDLSIALRYHSASRFLVTIGLYSNITWVGMVCTLLAGGCVIINGKFDPMGVWQKIERRRITHLCMVPLMYQNLIEAEHEQVDASSLVNLMSAGSPLHAHTREAIFKRLPCAITELYGLTEGVITTLEPEQAKGRMASAGLPLQGCDLMILDEGDQICAAGQSGEIVFRGRIVMPGYFNRPDATKASLYIDEQGRHWIRTGDIGYLDADGYLFIVDRKKDMILSGGQNIYPQDIEAILITHGDVVDTAVIGVESKKWGETPLGLVVLKRGAITSSDQIKKWINAQVGKQQRVADIKIIDKIARNPNGKCMKNKLREQFKGVVYD